MQTNESFEVLDELMQTLEDGIEGFAAAIAKLDPAVSPSELELFTSLRQQRQDFRDDLRKLGMTMGHEVEEKGTIAGKLHRSWMGLKDVVSGSDAGGVVDVVEQGEGHALNVFTDACAKDLPHQMKVLVEHQRGAILASYAHVAQMV
jgi:uncharacterized protein (TIGR02284 family)